MVSAAHAPTLSDSAPLYWAALVVSVGLLEGLLAYFLASKLSQRVAALTIGLIIACNIGAAVWLRPEHHEMVTVLAGIFLVASIFLGWAKGRRNQTGKSRLLAWAPATVLAAVALATWTHPDILGNFARSRAYEAQEKARLESEEASAQQCVAELAQRDPRADAEQDFARGDATPIGLTSKPHDPPDPETQYPVACEHGYDGEYRRTGKWFTYTSSGYSMFSRPPSYGRCQRETYQYVEDYNRRMVELAPMAVRQFCRSQELADSSRLVPASIAVLGTAWEKRETIGGRAYRTEASLIVDTEFGPVLVTRSYPPNSAPYCESCLVGMGVAYLKEDGDLITARRRWPLVWAVGLDSQHDEVTSKSPSLTDLLTSYPLLGIIGRRAHGHDNCGWHTFFELRPEGPVSRGTIYTRARPNGRYANVMRDHSFDIVVDGTDIRDHYEMRGGRFVGPNESKLRC